MQKQVLRVGLDLDGVILYNPIRIARPVVVGLKRMFIKKKVKTFYVPKTPIEQAIWTILHKTSIFVAPGFEEFKNLAMDKKIELYIITARYSFLRHDFEEWVVKIEGNKCLTGYFYNKQDEQPHVYKERMIRDLKLDVFVEDNWDIVKHLQANQAPATVMWIYNILDRGIEYPHKFPSLKKAYEAVETMIQR